MKKVRKAISYLLIVCLMTTIFPSTVFAATQGNKETYTSVELGIILEKVTTNEKVTVYTKSLDGKLLHTGINNKGRIYLDGKYLPEWSDSPHQYSLNKSFNSQKINSNRISTKSSDWGNWVEDTDTLQTGGLPVAVVAGLIALKAGWTPLGVIAVIAAATAGKYDTIRIDWKTRFKTDAKFQYVERITTYYGDGKFISVPGNPHHENLKRPLDM